MNLDGITRGDILGNISDKLRDMPEPISKMIDNLLELSGENRREVVVYDALEFYQEALTKAKEGYITVEIKREDLEGLKMKETHFYQLSLPGINY
ncbi:hypothetical protein HYV89_05725 [Candidatus Woesearchaeota archaeon]|nr:hypothetical protein [Candidatus Woesearchaeota archaeon]